MNEVVTHSQAPTFSPKFHFHRVALGVLIAATLGWVAYVDTTWTRYFAAFFCILVATLTGESIRRETAVAQNCLIAPGTVTELERGRRGGFHVVDSFLAFDGKPYTGRSFWSVRKAELGGPINVVYSALVPSKNLPLSGFMFYEFKLRPEGIE